MTKNQTDYIHSVERKKGEEMHDGGSVGADGATTGDGGWTGIGVECGASHTTTRKKGPDIGDKKAAE